MVTVSGYGFLEMWWWEFGKARWYMFCWKPNWRHIHVQLSMSYEISTGWGEWSSKFKIKSISKCYKIEAQRQAHAWEWYVVPVLFALCSVCGEKPSLLFFFFYVPTRPQRRLGRAHYHLLFWSAFLMHVHG